MKNPIQVFVLLSAIALLTSCQTTSSQSARKSTEPGANPATSGSGSPSTPRVKQAPLFGSWNNGSGSSSRKSLTMRGNSDPYSEGEARAWSEGKEAESDDSAGFLFGNRSGSTIQRGNTFFHSDGSATIQRGNRFYNTDGSSAVRSGNTLFKSDGSTTTRSGNTYYNSDGSSTIQSGNAYFNSDGTATIRKGNGFYNSGGD